MTDNAISNDAARKYFELLRDASEYLDARGVLITKRIVLLRMDEIYVQLKAARKVKREIRIPQKSIEESETEEKARELEASEEMQFDESEDSEGQIRQRKEEIRIVEEEEEVDIPELVSSEKRIVVLGDPGSGKTTFLRNIAFKISHSALDNGWDAPISDNEYFTEELSRNALESNGIPVPVPIPITLRYFARALNEGRANSLEDYIRDYVVPDLLDIASALVRSKEVIGGLTPAEKKKIEDFREAAREIGEWLLSVAKDGIAYLLLDGLDEVANRETRNRLVDEILRFEAEHPQHSYVATSRIVGYGLRPLPDRYAHATLRPFDDERIERFVRKWYEALYEAESRLYAVKALRAETEAQRLLEELNQKQQLKAIATNPLILTIIGLIHHQGTKLPNQRVALYREVVDTFIWSWEEYKRIEGITADMPDPRETRLILAEVALYLHEKTEDNLIPKSKFHEIVSGFAEKRGKTDPEGYAERFIKLVSERSGVLSEKGQDTFGFMHLTFQEYFAAVAITRRRARIDSYITQYLWDSRWNEVILLGAGIQGEKSPEDAKEYIETILKTSHPLEPYLHHGLLTAARCLADDVDILDYPEIVNRIFDELEKIYFDDRSPAPLKEKIIVIWNNMARTIYREKLISMFNRNMAEIPPQWGPYGGFDVVTEALIKIDNLQFDGKNERIKHIANAISKRLEDEDSDVRYAALNALSSLGIKDEDVVEKIVKRLKDKYSYVRKTAINALSSLGVKDKDVILEIVKRLEDVYPDVRYAALNALSSFEVKDKDVIEKIVRRLEQEDWRVRLATLNALSSLGVKDMDVILEIAKRLEDKYPDVRLATLNTLSSLGVRDKDVILEIVKRLEDEDWRVRHAAINALSSPNVNDIILELIEILQHEDWRVRRAALNALSSFGIKDKNVILEIVKRLEDKDRRVRRAALNALSSFGIKDKNVILEIVKRLEDEDSWVRGAAINTLSSLGVKDVDIILEIVKRLEDKYPDVRYVAINALSSLGVRDKDVILEIVKRLEGKAPDIREVALNALSSLGTKDKNVIGEIVKRLEDVYPDVREAALNALSSLGVKDEDVILEIAKRLEDVYPDVREAAIDALSFIGVKDKEVIGKIAKRLEDEDPNVRKAAINALSSIGVKDEDVVSEIAKRLEDEDPNVRKAAIDALSFIGVKDKEVIGKIVKRLEDVYPDVRGAALNALSSLGVKDEDVILEIAKRLEDGNRNVRYVALNALLSLGVKDKDVILEIAKRLEHEDPDVRNAAYLALEELYLGRGNA